jgi:hypothetical protein
MSAKGTVAGRFLFIGIHLTVGPLESFHRWKYDFFLLMQHDSSNVSKTDISLGKGGLTPAWSILCHFFDWLREKLTVVQ